MPDYFREVFEALKQSAEAQIQAHGALAQAHEALGQAHEAMGRANDALKRAFEAVLSVKSEHEDLRESVHRLESLVIELLRKQQ